MWTHLPPPAAALAPLVLVLAALALPSAPGRLRPAARAATALAFALVLLACLGPAQGNGGRTALLELGSPLGVPLSLAVQLDALSCLAALLVSGLGLLLVGYSNRYLAGDPGQRRFQRGLLLTLAAVLGLVLSGNLLMLLACWILTSLCLHGLLTFYPERAGAQLAARKKFLFSRLGEVCLALATALAAQAFGSLEFELLFERARELQASGQSLPQLPWIAGLVVVAALIKCAQFPFHGWLPEVMETPTPVSALLHAGIINAGGFLVLRLSPLLALEPGALAALALVGGGTALFAGLVMGTQNSIKVALAWSTCAQMGFMLMQCGLGAFSTAALHLLAHSLYKAHAFLSAGSVAEELRQGGPRAPRPARGAGQRLLALGAAGMLGLALGLALGLDPLQQPGKLTLSAILGLGLAALWLERRSARQTLPIAAGAAALAGLYFALSAGLAWLLGPSVAADLPLAATAGAWLPIGLCLAFAAVLLLHAPLEASRSGRAYVWLHAGGYMNALWDRWVMRRWPLPEQHLSRRELHDSDASAPGAPARLPQDLGPVVERALARCAPVWPLDRFVAVNPYLGLSGQPFEAAAAELERVRGARGALPREEYRRRVARGEIERCDLEAALEQAGRPLTLAQLERELEQPSRPRLPDVLTVAEALDAEQGGQRAALVTRELGKWCAAYFDRHQATWRMPWADSSLFAAGRCAAALDRGLEVLGFAGVRAFFADLPADPQAALRACLAALGLSGAALDDYLHRALASLSGWVAHTRRLAFEAAQAGRSDRHGLELLALRVAYDAALARAEPEIFARAWPAALAHAAAARQRGASRELTIDLTLQRAHELAYERGLLARWQQPRRTPAPAAPRATAHVVLCIDVRSEVLRRQLEGLTPAVSSSGFAGFFGLALEFVRAGDAAGQPHCPVLLTPKLRFEETAAPEQRLSRRARLSAWHGFKTSPVGSFAFVESLGLSYAEKLFNGAAALAPGQSAGAPRFEGSAPELAARADLAQGILGAMSLPERLPRLVLLAGHGGQSANNLHAAGLDCGACGGQNGAASARAAAALLNAEDVRAELARRGRALPAEVRFLAGLHDTTTDRFTLFDTESLPAELRPDLDLLAGWLAEAGRRTRLERAARLGLGELGEAQQHAAIARRARDWAEVRPEWALAGNAAFIAAPRARTRGLDLAGRSFLHEYDWRRDDGFAVLELILTAPVVVANWINLQYFGSSVDPQLFGSGNKVLHNAVGGQLGVLLGSGGDLMTGLPWQSVHDGQEYMHAPLRLQVFVEAPAEAIDAILARQPAVRELVDNGWLHLWRIRSEDGRPLLRVAQGLWEQRAAAAPAPAAEPRAEILVS